MINFDPMKEFHLMVLLMVREFGINPTKIFKMNSDTRGIIMGDMEPISFSNKYRDLRTYEMFGEGVWYHSSYMSTDSHNFKMFQKMSDLGYADTEVRVEEAESKTRAWDDDRDAPGCNRASVPPAGRSKARRVGSRGGRGYRGYVPPAAWAAAQHPPRQGYRRRSRRPLAVRPAWG